MNKLHCTLMFNGNVNVLESTPGWTKSRLCCIAAPSFQSFTGLQAEIHAVCFTWMSIAKQAYKDHSHVNALKIKAATAPT